MPLTLCSKIYTAHNLNDEELLSLIPEQVLLHDALGTPVCLQLERADITTIRPLLAIYCDHNTLQIGYRNSDDHAYLHAMAKRLGAYFFGPGEGICHQTHLEHFARPGEILLGADSHTPTCGAVGMLSIGVGGLTAAGALAGIPCKMQRPKTLGIELTGSLPAWATAKDVALHLLQCIRVKGGLGKIIEFHGPGVASLSVFDRACICNMGAETGATTSIFPSDERTLEFLQAVGRKADWRPLTAEDGAVYDENLCINLSAIVPMVALPCSPDNVCPVQEVEGLHLDQVCIGSCTNASYPDLALVSAIWQGRRLPSGLDVTIAAGTRLTLAQLAEEGHIRTLIHSGARLLEPCCGPCNALGLSPGSGKTSLRTFNRNFKGRSGTADAAVYLCSPPTAAVSALEGILRDPRSFGRLPRIVLPANFVYSFTPETQRPDKDFPVQHGPNIKPMPLGIPVPDTLILPVKLCTGDNITTDHILPGGNEMLALRSNVPASVPYLFERIDPDFGGKAEHLPPHWCIVAGENFGQGSSREHAVMVPLHLGMGAVLAVSFARIYRRNLINYGILPLVFSDPENLRDIGIDDVLVLEQIHAGLSAGKVSVLNQKNGHTYSMLCPLSADEHETLLAGGVLRILQTRRADEGRSTDEPALSEAPCDFSHFGKRS